MISGRSLLLFDFDGVLADSIDVTLNVSSQVAREFGAAGEMNRELLSSLEEMTIECGGRAMGVPEEELQRFKSALRARYETMDQDYRIFSGVKSALRALSAHHLLGVVTNNSEKLVRRFSRTHGIDHLLRLILGIETGGEKSARILQAARESAVSLEQTYMLGDAASDILEARRAGCKAIGVTWGFQGRKFLEAAGPDYLLSSPEQLVDLFCRSN